MGFMELDMSFNIEMGGGELPHRAIQLHGSEPNGRHRVQEVVPGDFARRRGYVGVEEKRAEYLQGACIYGECRLLVISLGCKSGGCQAALPAIRCRRQAVAFRGF